MYNLQNCENEELYLRSGSIRNYFSYFNVEHFSSKDNY
jgi:hypothetical protein